MNKELREFLDEYSAQHLYELTKLREVFTQNSQPVLGSLAIPVGSTEGALTVLANSAGRCVGWSLRETSGTDAATVELYDGTNDDGRLLFPITLTAGQSVRDWFGPAGVSFTTGLFAKVAAGAVDGTVWIGRYDR